MANTAKKRIEDRQKRKQRVRKKIQGTVARPRLCVFRSSKFTYAQLIADDEGRVIASCSTAKVEAKSEDGKVCSPGGVLSAKELGKRIAEVAKENKIEQIVFDRNGYLYHGRVAAVADGAREGGLKF